MTEEIKDRMGYVYLHILPCDTVAYVGVGTCGNNYLRAYDKQGRSEFWKSVVGRQEYRVEIIYDNIPYSEALEKEIELIEKFGRRFLDQGTLVNFHPGGLWNPTDEERKILQEAHKKRKSETSIPYKLKGPDGQIYEGENIAKFSRERGLCPTTISGVLKGRFAGHRGYCLPDNMTYTPPQTHFLVSPRGRLFSFVDVAEFVKEHDLDIYCIYAVLRGKNFHYHAWHLPDPSEEVLKSIEDFLIWQKSEFYDPNYKVGNRKLFSLVSPEGMPIYGYDLSWLSEFTGFDKKGFSCLINKWCNSNHGYTRLEPESEDLFYELVSPEGKLYRFLRITEFCRERDLSAACINQVFAGECRQHKGWHHPRLSKEDLTKPLKIRKRKNELFIVVNEESVYAITNFVRFAKKHEIARSMLQRFKRGESCPKLKAKGWRLATENDIATLPQIFDL